MCFWVGPGYPGLYAPLEESVSFANPLPSLLVTHSPWVPACGLSRENSLSRSVP